MLGEFVTMKQFDELEAHIVKKLATKRDLRLLRREMKREIKLCATKQDVIAIKQDIIGMKNEILSKIKNLNGRH